MTRFDADTEEDRHALFAEAIAAHRTRKSQFCTFETGDGTPWIQIGSVEEEMNQSVGESGMSVLNLDCTDDELDRLKTLLNEFPDFSIEEFVSPENVQGTNVHVGTYAGDERIAGFVERSFRTVYDRPEGYVVWVTEI